jgi:hypothetical protein
MVTLLMCAHVNEQNLRRLKRLDHVLGILVYLRRQQVPSFLWMLWMMFIDFILHNQKTEKQLAI